MRCCPLAAFCSVMLALWITAPGLILDNAAQGSRSHLGWPATKQCRAQYDTSYISTDSKGSTTDSTIDLQNKLLHAASKAESVIHRP